MLLNFYKKSYSFTKGLIPLEKEKFMKQLFLFVLLFCFFNVAQSQETIYIPNPEINGLKQDVKLATLKLILKMPIAIK